MAWITTKDGRQVNTDWFDEEERKKYAQIEENQKQADSRNNQDKYEKVPGLIFGVAKISRQYIDIDGYSNKATERGMLSDLARAVEKYDPDEAEGIRGMVKFNEVVQTHPAREDGPAQYICEWEEVPAASRMVDKNGKDSNLSGNDGVDIERKSAKYYVHVRIIR